MIRALLATTALATLLSAPALAQDASSSVDMSLMSSDSSMMSSEMPSDSSTMLSEMPSDSSPMMESSAMDTSSMTDSSMMSSEPMNTMSSVQPAAPFDITTGYTRVDSDRLATHIIGQPVYDSGAADANNVGNINDLVLNESGDVAAVVIGVGGFLGIGEKQVAVSYASLQWVVAADNTERFVLETTVDQLTAAPDFVTVDDDPNNANASGDAAAPADAMAPPDSTMSSSAAQ